MKVLKRERKGTPLRPKNNIRVHQHRILPYTYNCVVTTNCGFSEEQTIIKEDSYKVVYDGLKTVVVLCDGSVGISKCNAELDTYNVQKGHDIAHHRAKIKQSQKKLKELTR